MTGACPRCALPSLPSPAAVCGDCLPSAAICGDCLSRPPPLRTVVAAFRYAFPVDRMAQALKYRGELAVAGWFGDRLADAVGRHQAGHALSVDALIALPLSTARQRTRGFNQAAEIARRAADHLQLRCDSGLRRLRDTPPQVSLPWSERTRNMRNAFAATRRFDGERITIIDDVMTTGATLHAAAQVLLDAGAQSVDAWVVARTLR